MKVLKTKEFKIKPWSTGLTIADPMYLDELAEGINTKTLNRLTLVNYKPYAAKYGTIEIRLIEDAFQLIEVRIFRASTDEIIETYKDGKMFVDTLKESKDLGCDTAEFIIDVNGKQLNFNTGADGSYGYASLFKMYYGCNINLWFDTSLWSFDEIVKNFEYLFT